MVTVLHGCAADILAPKYADRRKFDGAQRTKSPTTPSALTPAAAARGATASDDAVIEKLPHSMVRFNNNGLTSLAPLYRTVELILINPAALTWIDLSFNAVVEIGPAFKRFTNLKRLYLHSNAIDALAEVEHLQANRNLQCLTLHANPVQEKKNYRVFGKKTLLCNVLHQSGGC